MQAALATMQPTRPSPPATTGTPAVANGHAAQSSPNISPTKSPTNDQLVAFARDGFLSWGPLLAGSEIEALRAEYDRVFAEAHGSDTYRNLSVGDEARADAKRSGRQMLQIMQMCERSLAFRRLLYDERILAVVRAIIGPNIMLFHDQALFKPARTGGAVSWHQDNGYWKCAPANLVSCWLTLDDVVTENGAMQVIPGSHLAPAQHGQDPGTSALLQVQAIPVEKAVSIPLPAGGCMFHHCQTLHYTAPNDTERQRRALAIHYMPVGTTDSTGNIMRVSWARPQVCSSM